MPAGGLRLLRSAGVQLATGTVVAVVISVAAWRPPCPDVAGRLALLLGATVFGLSAVARATPRRWRCGVRVAIALAALAASRWVVPDAELTFAACYLPVFVYVGLSLPRGASWAILPVALPLWLVTNGSTGAAVLSRIPIVAGMWLVVGEVLASRTADGDADRVALTEAAERDALTGLYNRAGFEGRVSQLAVRDAVVMIDLDHFKAVNDTFGHRIGDRMLRDFGRVLLAVLRDRDTAVRYGGEEFMLLLPQAGHDGADRALTRIKAGWNAAHPESTFSAGVAVIAASGSAYTTIAEADEALYAAKRSGRAKWLHAQSAHRDQPQREAPTPTSRGARVAPGNDSTRTT